MNIPKPAKDSSPLTLRITVFVDDHWNRLKTEQIIPWTQLIANGVKCKNFYGKDISYTGVSFEGSPQMVFWGGYIDPFLRSVIDQTFDYAVSLCREREEPLRPALAAVEQNLRKLVRETYQQMSEVDRVLRGRGYPEKLSLRPVDSEISAMHSYIVEQIKSELEMWKPKPWLTRQYERHPLWFWLAPFVISIVSLVRTYQ